MHMDYKKANDNITNVVHNLVKPQKSSMSLLYWHILQYFVYIKQI